MNRRRFFGIFMGAAAAAATARIPSFKPTPVVNFTGFPAGPATRASGLTAAKIREMMHLLSAHKDEADTFHVVISEEMHQELVSCLQAPTPDWVKTYTEIPKQCST